MKDLREIVEASLNDSDRQIMVNALINQIANKAYKEAINDVLHWLQDAHGKSNGRHNYYSHAYHQIKRMKK